MGFGGGGGAASGVSAHKHNSQTGEGGPLQFRNDIVNGTSLQFNGGTEIPAEVLV
tara:strand:+ start:407 stop:571 length:165 start_codon:yes stop_codon:yes gene_type:complete